LKFERSKKLLREALFFGLIGFAGFLIDVAVLYLIKSLVGLLYGRLTSFMAAVAFTWLMNRRWTFKKRSSGLNNAKEFLVYLAIMLIGGLINFGLYVWLVFSFQLFQANPVLGVAFGSLAGMLINFSLSRFILYGHQKL
jgi:putative flippase GtrA